MELIGGVLAVLLASLILLCISWVLHRSACALEQPGGGAPRRSLTSWVHMAAGHVLTVLALGAMVIAWLAEPPFLEPLSGAAWWYELLAAAAGGLSLSVGLGAYLIQLLAGVRAAVSPGTQTPPVASGAGSEPGRTTAGVWVWWRSSFGAVVAVLGLCLGLVLWMVMAGLLFSAEPQLFDRLLQLTVMLLSQLVLLTGLVLLRARRLEVQSATRAAECHGLLGLLRGLSRLYLAGGLLLTVLPGVPLLLLIGIVSWSTYAAVRRASRLRALWLLATSVRGHAAWVAALQQQAENCTGLTRRWLSQVVQRLERGQPLSLVLSQTSLVPRADLLNLAGGFSCGKVAEVLQDLAARETSRFAACSAPGHRHHLLTYWSLGCVVLLTILTFLSVSIIPKFKRIFDDFQLALPSSTQMVLAMTEGLTARWYLVVPAWLIFCGWLLRVDQEVQLEGWWQAWEKRVGRWWLRGRAPDLLRGLRWAVLTNQPLERVLTHMASVPVPRSLRVRLHQVAQRVSQGEDPWLVLHAQGWLSNHEAELLKAATQAGHLAWTLGVLSDSVQARREYRAALWAEWLNPTVLLLAGVLVGFLVYSLFLPLVVTIQTLAEQT